MMLKNISPSAVTLRELKKIKKFFVEFWNDKLTKPRVVLKLANYFIRMMTFFCIFSTRSGERLLLLNGKDLRKSNGVHRFFDYNLRNSTYTIIIISTLRWLATAMEQTLNEIAKREPRKGDDETKGLKSAV